MHAIIRTQKHSSNATLGGMEKHVDRTMDVPNANKKFEKFNQHLVGENNSLIHSIDSRIDKLKKEHNPRITKSSVKAIEYMMTASPEAFNFHSSEDGKSLKGNVKRWNMFLKNSRDFLVKKHGKENLVKFTFHMDEKTPHIHAFVVPVTKDNRLSAKEFLGGKEKLQNLQTEFADQMKELGLKRGQKGTKTEHESIQKYYARVEESEKISLVQNQLDSESRKSFKLPKPPAIGRESWRSEQEALINQELKRLQISLSNERSVLNDTKSRLNEERSTRRINEGKIKKLETRIWHIENPVESKKLSEDRKLEQKILQGKSTTKGKGLGR